jgi:hypothetical protein
MDVFKNYRSLNSPRMVKLAFVLQVMDFREEINHNAFFDYADRYANVSYQTNMWKTYRNNYGCTWQRDDITDTYSQGHYNCNGELFRCNWAKSVVGKLVNSCSDYGSNQRAKNYDPCQVC